MPDIAKTLASLEKNGMHPHYFTSAAQALDYLVTEIRDTSVGMGGSVSARQMGVYEALGEHNTCLLYTSH